MNQLPKAIIFDMNGVIINDERVHQQSWKEFCQKYKFSLSEDDFKNKVFGRTEADTLTYLFNKKLTDNEISNYSDERVKTAIDIFKPQLKLNDGLLNLLIDLKNNDIPIAIATGSRTVYTNFIIDGLKIKEYFKQITTAQEVFKGKPDPEIYLLTANKLNVDPKDCIVFEDSISGIKAAKSANMKVVAITTTHQRDELLIADKVIDSFTEITVKELGNI